MKGLPAVIMTALIASSCSKSSTSTSTPPVAPTPATAAVAITFDANPVTFSGSGCSFSTPQGWFTQAKIQETAGVAITVATFTQKLDGNPASALTESFNSRFGACSGGTFNAGAIAASGTVCGTVGVCTTSTYSTYQFSIAGTDANGHAVTFDSPLLRLNAR